MEFVEDPSSVRFQPLGEIADGFGSSLFYLAPQSSLLAESFEASLTSRILAQRPKPESICLSYVFTPAVGSGTVMHLRRLVQTLDLHNRDDTKASLPMLIARHLDAAVEINSDG